MCSNCPAWFIISAQGRVSQKCMRNGKCLTDGDNFTCTTGISGGASAPLTILFYQVAECVLLLLLCCVRMCFPHQIIFSPGLFM